MNQKDFYVKNTEIILHITFYKSYINYLVILKVISLYYIT